MRPGLLWILLAAVAGIAVAADLTGKWTGSFNPAGSEGENNSNAVLNLKQDGAVITGTAGPSDDEQYPVKSGKIEGDKITLHVDHDGHTLIFELQLKAERLTGEAHMERDGRTMKARVDVGRAK